MGKNTSDAERQLEVTLQQVLEKGQVQIHVTDDDDPAQPIPAAQVKVMDGTTIVTGVTDANGEVTLEIGFSSLKPFEPKTVTVVASKDGYTQQAPITVTVIAVATIDVHAVLVSQ
jgi:hypothetical protein